MTGTILERIVETKRREIQDAKRANPKTSLEETIQKIAAPRDFYRCLTTTGAGVRLIAEIKKASPFAGVIRPDFNPVAIATTYEHCGAAALSILTDRTYFAGDLSFIEAVKKAVRLPVLRKDFLIDEYQVFQSRAAGADAILLIAEILTPAEIEAFSKLACVLGMTSIVEVRDVDQYRQVSSTINAEQRVILGINNRDLRTQTTDIHATRLVAAEIPPGTPFVSESGIKTRADVLHLQSVGATALLVGEIFMRADDIGKKVRELVGQD